MKLTEDQKAAVRRAVADHLQRSEGFRALPPPRQAEIASGMVSVADALAADATQDPTQAAIADVDFPSFVDSLVKGTFQADVNVSAKQVQAYADLLRNVSSSSDAPSKLPPKDHDSALPHRPPGLPKSILQRARDLDLVIKAPPSGDGAIDIDLDGGPDIIVDNLNAVAMLYLAAQLEEMKLFAVADRVVEQFVQGMLPIAKGPDGDRITAYFRTANERISEADRRAHYGFLFGTGDSPGRNTEFDGLWIAFLTAIHALSTKPASAADRTARVAAAGKSGRALAVNLSQRGNFTAAATQLSALLQQTLDLLRCVGVLQAYAVPDVWTLVDRISTLYLGGAAPGASLRARAQAGAAILAWLAEHAGSKAARVNPPLTGPVERWLAAPVG